MKKSQISPKPVYFDRYIDLVQNENLLDGLFNSIDALVDLDIELLEDIGDETYAEGKWTVKDILQHIIDTERIMAYRALRFARRDTTILAGFDESSFAQNTNTINRNIDDLIEELTTLRLSTIHLFKNFDEETLQQKGTCNNSEISVFALGFVIIGHQQHHLGIIKERYETLLVPKFNR